MLAVSALWLGLRPFGIRISDGVGISLCLLAAVVGFGIGISQEARRPTLPPPEPRE